MHIFPRLSRTKVIFHNFPGPGIFKTENPGQCSVLLVSLSCPIACPIALKLPKAGFTASEKPVFLKKPNPVGFFGFYWALGFFWTSRIK